MVFASSGGAVYGDTDTIPTPEDHPPQPASPYGAAKAATELYGLLYSRLYGLEFVALRYGNVCQGKGRPGGHQRGHGGPVGHGRPDRTPGLLSSPSAPATGPVQTARAGPSCSPRPGCPGGARGGVGETRRHGRERPDREASGVSLTGVVEDPTCGEGLAAYPARGGVPSPRAQSGGTLFGSPCHVPSVPGPTAQRASPGSEGQILVDRSHRG